MIASGTERAEDLAVNDARTAVLQEVVLRHGTPTFAYDIPRIRNQVDKLRTHLPPAIEILYSLKANASLGLCGVLAECGLGADVASAGELAIALAAGFPVTKIFLTGPDRSPALLSHLRSLPNVVISLDSASDLRLLAARQEHHRALLRLRPNFCSYATCSTGPDSRFGLTLDDVPSCRDFLVSSGVKVIGFHVFSGSQVLSAEGLIHHLTGGFNLALQAAEILGMRPEIIDIGGGFGVPAGPKDPDPDLALVGNELHSLLQRAAPARLVIELGRYLVGPSGWYLTTVLAHQTRHGRTAVVVDGGTHQRGDMCGLGLKQKGFAPLVIAHNRSAQGDALVPTDVLGCLSLPGDVLAEACPLPPLAPGDILAFPNAGAYGLAASPWLFHSHPAPAEVAFEGSSIQPLRFRQPPESVLEDQVRLGTST